MQTMRAFNTKEERKFALPSLSRSSARTSRTSHFWDSSPLLFGFKLVLGIMVVVVVVVVVGDGGVVVGE